MRRRARDTKSKYTQCRVHASTREPTRTNLGAYSFARFDICSKKNRKGTNLEIMTAVIPVTGSTYHPRTPTPLTNLIHLQLGETTHREKPLSHDLLAKLVRHITIGKPRRAESATSDRHSRVCQSPFPSYVSFLPRSPQ